MTRKPNENTIYHNAKPVYSHTIQISLKDALEQRLALVPEGALYTHWHWQQVPLGAGQYKELGLIYED